MKSTVLLGSMEMKGWGRNFVLFCLQITILFLGFFEGIFGTETE